VRTATWWPRISAKGEALFFAGGTKSAIVVLLVLVGTQVAGCVGAQSNHSRWLDAPPESVESDSIEKGVRPHDPPGSHL